MLDVMSPKACKCSKFISVIPLFLCAEQLLQL